MALGAEVIQAQRGLNGRVNQVLRLKPSPTVEEIPLILIIGDIACGCVEECVLIDQAEELEECVEGVLAFVAQ